MHAASGSYLAHRAAAYHGGYQRAPVVGYQYGGYEAVPSYDYAAYPAYSSASTYQHAADYPASYSKPVDYYVS